MTTLAAGIRVIKDILVEYIDIDYSLWLTWLLTPLLLSFLLPLVIILLFYTTAMILYIYKHREKLRGLSELDFWNRARKTVALLWDAHGWVWYGYEIEGLENLPDGGALIVYYHGTLPVDLYYFIARVYLLKNRLVQTVADRFLFNIPGWNIISEGIKVIPGTVNTCCQIVESGNLLAVSPGGVYEALFGDQSYPIMWKSRVGFAKVALQAKVPIIPMFTENVREAFRTMAPMKSLWLKLYNWTRLPFMPIYGGFPVKLVTHLGSPVLPSPSSSPQQLQKECAEAINALIEKHQRLPGCIMLAVADRFYRKPKREIGRAHV